MPTLAGLVLPPPRSWDEFEEIALSAAKLRWNSTDLYRHGRQGQRQDGVDIFGHAADGRHIGIQGKNTVDGITVTTVNSEVAQAETFQPPLDALYIATTAKRDVAIQKQVRLISQRRKKAGKFPVAVLFWEDICQDLAADDAVFFKHFPQFRPSADPAREHDQKLFDELSQLLSSNGLISFIDQHNMAGFSFADAKLDPLREFYYEWNKPERAFLTPEIEAAKIKLWEKADEYLEVIATETFSTERNVDRRWVPEDWEITQPERFWRVVKRLHALAGEIVALHAELIWIGKLHLIGRSGGR
ncbi:MAG: hypothetical protein HXY22_04330 [Alphaproteobacteria bacterium]|nr:hypothetical protein [Alphaproteobacteria bacterium]